MCLFSSVEITPYIPIDESRFCARRLSSQLSTLLLDLLGSETDVHNLRMLMSELLNLNLPTVFTTEQIVASSIVTLL